MAALTRWSGGTGRAFDVIVFGATGFTGRALAKYIHSQDTDLKWAIAGKSQAKLSSLKAELINLRLTRNLPDILLADANDYRALCDMLAEASIVVNCTGPSRFFGKELVEACLKTKCTYMDVCGDAQFMESCLLNCHDRAIEGNVLILHACGFDAVPADLGVLYTLRQFPPARCSAVESYLTVDNPKGLKSPYTTYHQAVYGAGDMAAVKETAKAVKKKYKHSDVTHYGPPLKKPAAYGFEKRLQKHVTPALSADVAVVRASQRTLATRTDQLYWPQYRAYATVGSAYTAAAASLYGTVFSAVAASPWGKALMTAYPESYNDGVFSKEGPSQEHLNTTTFQMHFFGRGFSRPYGAVRAASTGSIDDDEEEKGEVKEEEEKVGLDDGEAKVGDKLDPGEAVAAMSSSSSSSSSAGGTRRSHPGTAAGPGTGTGTGAGAGAGGTLMPVREAVPRSEVSGTSSLARACSLPGLLRVFSPAPALPGDAPPEECDKHIHVLVSGPEPTHIAGPAACFALALCVLEERGRLPPGGVLTPASALYDVPSIFDRLALAGIQFEVVTTETVTAGVGSVSARNGQNAQAEATASDAAVVKSPPAGLVDDAMADLHISTLMPVRGGGSGGDGDVDDEYEGGICPPLRAVG